ncbi:HopJ type III effector protein [Tenacibaculum lutimaris]|uniref:HopJ type III effector protein n=1 Tax=Tenacibaculum lutimaris TaxID=285258 RepID=A0A420E511_9FLAO|nr:HopJ type III effector protein [Tenacibaculum lutimaris]RKF04983.1 HopJ type III effector protein [Tenacibaculum lutimaris]
MRLDIFKQTIQSTPEKVEFSDTMSVIENVYNFTPTAFKNGDLYNEAEKNQGSCKVFSFAIQQGFSKEETLACFGQYYFEDVLKNPEGTDHQNIRNFMKTGFEGLLFEGDALKKR